MSEGDKRPLETVKEWFRHADQNLAVAERELAHLGAGYHTIQFVPKMRIVGGQVETKMIFV
jgi:hypothetical protein